MRQLVVVLSILIISVGCTKEKTALELTNDAVEARGDIKRAILLLDKAIDKDPNYLPAYLNKSRFLVEDNQYNEALSVIQTIEKKDGENWTLLEYKGFILDKLGRTKEASETFISALSSIETELKSSPSDSLKVNYSLALFMAGKKEERLKLMQELAKKKKPEDFPHAAFLELFNSGDRQAVVDRIISDQ